MRRKPPCRWPSSAICVAAITLLLLARSAVAAEVAPPRVIEERTWSAAAVYGAEDRSLFGRVVGPRIDEAIAMRFVYGNWNAVAKKSELDLDPDLVTRLPGRNPCTDGCSEPRPVVPVASRTVTGLDGRRRFILLTSTDMPIRRPGSYTNVLGGALFRETSAGWILLSETKLLGLHNARRGGLASAPQIVRIGADAWGAVLQAITFDMRDHWFADTLVVGEIGDRLYPLLGLADGEYFGDIDRRSCYLPTWCAQFTSRYRLLPRAGSRWYDLERITVGDRHDDIEMRPDESPSPRSAFVRERRVYRLVDGAYR